MEYTIKNVGGIIGGEAILFETEKGAFLFDTGFAFSAQAMIKNIKKELGNKSLDYILLTHSHYDHASGSPYCKEAYPEVKIVSGGYTSKIFSKETARKHIREMDRAEAQNNGINEYHDLINNLSVDIIVEDGDIFEAAGIKFQAISMPGHTKCCMGFYMLYEEILLSSETVGVMSDPDKMKVMPACLVGYDMAIETINRVIKLQPRAILLPHYEELISGDNCSNFLNSSLYWHNQTKEIIIDSHKQGLKTDDIIDQIGDILYQPFLQKYYPVKAFRLNTGIMIERILSDLSE